MRQHGTITKLGIAVSGGGDSMALLHLAHEWTQVSDISLVAVTVDHGLRREAAAEAAMVEKACKNLKVAHTVLKWSGWDKKGNLQDAARRARYGLISGEWAQKMQLDAVAIGHTLDDVAETFLMRLARGSGVDGLATMRSDWQTDGMRWIRPMLGISRNELRTYLGARDIAWVEDPSNDDENFDRVKARRMLEVLKPLGLDADRLAATAQHMTRASLALRHHAHRAALCHCQVERGDVVFSAHFWELPDEVRYRLVSDALMWVSTTHYRPRFEALVKALANASEGKRRPLHGCLIAPTGGGLRILREYQAVKETTSTPEHLWDSRWLISGPGEGLVIRALGEAVNDCPNWRETGLPRASLLASPSVWRGGELIAAPLAGESNGFSATISPNTKDFFTSVLSH